MGPNYIALAIPGFFFFILVELGIARRRRLAVYHFADALTDLGCGVGQQVLGVFFGASLVAVYVWVFEHARLVTLPAGTVWPWLIAIAGVDLVYYWWHRLSHEVAFMWAVHVVHHQSEDFNLAVALRQAVFSDITLSPFYLTLALAGVEPIVVLTVRSFSTLYQFWIHTELVGRLGPLEGLINTPSAHRVHHGVNPQYQDRNYAAVLLIWDRLFGTYEPEVDAPVFGITHPLRTFNSLWAQVHFWADLWHRARRAPSPGGAIAVFLRRPGWRGAWESDRHESLPVVSASSFVKHTVTTQPGTVAYLIIQFATVAFATFALLMWSESLPLVVNAAIASLVALALLAWGATLDGRPWARRVEVVRLVLLMAGGAAWLWRAPAIPWAGAAALAFAGVSLVWWTRSPSASAAASPA